MRPRFALRPAALALALATSLAGCARTAAPASGYAGARSWESWESCVGQRTIEVRNDSQRAIDVYARQEGAPAGNFLRSVDPRSTARIPLAVPIGVHTRTRADEALRGRTAPRDQVAVRYLCE